MKRTERIDIDGKEDHDTVKEILDLFARRNTHPMKALGILAIVQKQISKNMGVTIHKIEAFEEPLEKMDVN